MFFERREEWFFSVFFVIFLYITRYCQFKSRFVADNVGGCAFVDFLFAVAVDKALDKTYIIADAIELFPLGKITLGSQARYLLAFSVLVPFR